MILEDSTLCGDACPRQDDPAFSNNDNKNKRYANSQQCSMVASTSESASRFLSWVPFPTSTNDRLQLLKWDNAFPSQINFVHGF